MNGARRDSRWWTVAAAAFTVFAFSGLAALLVGGSIGDGWLHVWNAVFSTFAWLWIALIVAVSIAAVPMWLRSRRRNDADAARAWGTLVAIVAFCSVCGAISLLR